MTSPADGRLVLIAGATGYVGGRLLGALVERGERLRCLSRRPEVLRGKVPAAVEVVSGDCLDASSLDPALAGVDTAYYLVHSMGAHGDFAEQDRRSARNFGEAARRAGVKRIIYLGGLGVEGHPGAPLSAHLQSRHETGELLGESGVPLVEFRASVILGSGSLSFEIIRALTERLPVMICPRWVATPAQPIAIEDVIAYLTGALDLPATRGVTRFEIGGADRVSYGAIMREYARQRGLRRLLISVPVLTPHLSSLWLGLVTPVYARVGRELIEGMRNPTVVQGTAASEAFAIRPLGLAEAIHRALVFEDRAFAETRWSEALPPAERSAPYGGVRVGSRIVDSRTCEVVASAAAAFAPIRDIGGASGRFWGKRPWRVRSLVEALFGRIGLRRSRRDPERVRTGGVLDFWCVERVEDGHRLLLSATMRLPGRAWLAFEVSSASDGRSTIRQTASFDPSGLSGLAYWYLLYPVHTRIFAAMLRDIGRRVTADQGGG